MNCSIAESEAWTMKRVAEHFMSTHPEYLEMLKAAVALAHGQEMGFKRHG